MNTNAENDNGDNNALSFKNPDETNWQRVEMERFHIYTDDVNDRECLTH